jgi:arylsulfatase A-like enzyme
MVVIRRTMNGKLFLLLCAFLITPIKSAATQQPNFVFFLTDDQRADTIRALGNRAIQTPNIDRLVQNGTAFTQAHILGAQQGAVCVPSRAMMLSGRTLFRIREDLKDIETWPVKLREGGYQTFMAGKWHNGRESVQRIFPNARAVFLGGMSDQNKVKVADIENGAVVNERIEDTYSAELFTDSALKFLETQTPAQPFCLYLAYTTPHDPRTAPTAFRARYRAREMKIPPNFLPEHPFDNGELKVRDENLLPHPRTPDAIQKEIADYYAAITATDAQIGRVLDDLKERGLEKNTVIIFAGDNGLAIGSHGLLGKQNLYEHSMRVPLIISGPGMPKGKRTAGLVSLNDLAPTICELAGVPAPAGSEALSLTPFFSRKNDNGRKQIFTAYRDIQRAITDGRWKLISYPKIHRVQLFDLNYDPHEIRDLSEDPKHEKTLIRMKFLLEREQTAAADPLLK